MDNLKLSIIIPTRERADTLLHTLATCTSQDYENLEIIVSDNASQDNTREVVSSYQDKRIRYINTNTRLGMSSNWEFGLSHVTGDFAMVLGDDDGLLPHAVKDIANILFEYKYPAIIWQKPNYNWPAAISRPNYLEVPLSNKMFIMNGAVLLYLIAKGYSAYGRLPVIYSGFVSMDLVENIRKKSGKFFYSIIPDVYSGFALLSQIKYYVYSFRPFSLNGGSHHSNGQSGALMNETAKLFYSENDLSQHPKMNVIPGSIDSCITEALLQANDHCFDGAIKVNLKRAIKNIFQELAKYNDRLQNNALAIMANLDLNADMKKYILRCQKKYWRPQPNKNSISSNHGIRPKEHLLLHGDKFSIRNIYDACEFINNILPTFKMPKTVPGFSTMNYFYTFCNRRISPFFEKRTF